MLKNNARWKWFIDVAVARDLEFTRNASNFTQVELEDQKYKDVFTEIMRPKRVIENVQEMEKTLEPIELFGTQLVKKASWHNNVNFFCGLMQKLFFFDIINREWMIIWESLN